MTQLSIPGAVFDMNPSTPSECRQMLDEMYQWIARSTVPEEWIKLTFGSDMKKRVACKRLREKMISDGYNLMLHLDEGVKSQETIDGMLWKQKAILLWNHFSTSVFRLSEYVESNSIR